MEGHKNQPSFPPHSKLSQKANVRWAKEEKKIDIIQALIMSKYNAQMGGADLIDRYISYYRISLWTHKWTVRVFAHFLDLACYNSWIQYQTD